MLDSWNTTSMNTLAYSAELYIFIFHYSFILILHFTTIKQELIRYVNDEYLVSNPASLVHVHDFLVADTSEDIEGCGNCVYVDKHIPLFAGYHTIILRSKYNHDNRYFAYLFLTDAWRGQIRSKVTGVKLFSISKRILSEVSVLTPPLPVQQKISNYLDNKCAKIDATIEKQQAIIEKLNEYRLSIITETVTKGLNPDVQMKDSGIVFIGEIPVHWEIKKLQTHTRMLTPMRDRPEDLGGSIPWVRIEDYCGKYISASKEGFGVSEETVKQMNLKIYPVGSVLCTSSCDLGKCAIVAEEIVSNQRFINIIPDDDLSSDYLYYMMTSNAERLNHLSTGTIQANLSRKAFEHLLVQFPPLSEQKEIASYLDAKCESIDDTISMKQKLIEMLAAYKKSLIYEVVTGKKAV